MTDEQISKMVLALVVVINLLVLVSIIFRSY